jgi:regulator of protease activity HflC (stomatin/prohibitin superfamily)
MASMKGFFGNIVQKMKKFSLPVTIGCLLILLIIGFFWNRIVVSIGSGEAGVLWKRFGDGTVIDRFYDEGVHFVAPWDKMYIYNIRNQEVKDSIDVLSVNGLTIHLDLSIRYHPHVDILGILHKEVGPDYVRVVVLPEIEAVVRTIIGQYKPEELYTAQKAIAEQIYVESFAQIEERYIALDDVLVKRIKLPTKIKNAIESKLEQQQMAQEYEFRLARERKEVERKQIEAQGLSEFSQCLNDKILKWQGIQATLKLAESPNTKIVITGNGQSQMPVLLNGQ